MVSVTVLDNMMFKINNVHASNCKNVNLLIEF
jgi:hypothetical protein